MNHRLTPLIKILAAGFALLAIAGLAGALRLRAVNRLPNDHDELTYLVDSRYYARSIQKGNLANLFQAAPNYEHPAFAKLVYAAALSNLKLPPIEKKDIIIGQTVTNPAVRILHSRARLTAAFFGVLAVITLAIINLPAGLFLAVHTVAVKYTSVVYLEAVPAFTSLLSVWAYLHWQKSKTDEKPKIPAPVWLGFSAIFLGLSVASKYVYGIAGLAILLDFLRVILQSRPGGWPAWKWLVAWGGLAIAAFFLADPYLWLDPVNRLRESLAFSIDFSQNAYVASFNYPAWQPILWLVKSVPQQPFSVYNANPEDFLIAIDLPIAILAVAGLPRMIRRQPVFAIWLVVGLVFLMLWKTKWPQYVMIILAPWCLSAGHAVQGFLTEPLLAALHQLKAKSSKKVKKETF